MKRVSALHVSSESQREKKNVYSPFFFITTRENSGKARCFSLREYRRGILARHVIMFAIFLDLFRYLHFSLTETPINGVSHGAREYHCKNVERRSAR